MYYIISILFVIVCVRGSRAQKGALQVIDYNGQCLMWSNNNFGCTGYSSPFGLLNGDDCSNISQIVNGTRHQYSSLEVDICGTENGQQVAWIKVTQAGQVNFINENGNQATCSLNMGLRAGSWCVVSENKLSTSALHLRSTSRSITTPSTTTPLSTASSAAAPSTTTPLGTTTPTPSTTISSTTTSLNITLSTTTPPTTTLSTMKNDVTTIECPAVVYPSTIVTYFDRCSTLS